MPRSACPSRGTTLIEFIIYLGIASGILFAVGGAALLSIESKEKARAIAETRNAASDALRRVGAGLSGALEIRDPLPSVATDTLRFRTPNGDGSVSMVDGRPVLALPLMPPVDLLPPSMRLLEMRFEGSGTASTTAVRVTLDVETGGESVSRMFRARTVLTTTVSPFALIAR